MLVEVVLFTGAATAALVYLARTSATGPTRARSELNSLSRDLERVKSSPGEHQLSANIWRVAIDCLILASDHATITLTLPHKTRLDAPLLITHAPPPHPDDKLELGAPDFDRCFHAAGSAELIFSALGASTRALLLEFARANAAHLEHLTVDERAVHAQLTLPKSELEFAWLSQVANKLSAIGRSLFGHGKSSVFDRLVHSAARDHAPRFREQCAMLILEDHSDRSRDLWRHDDPSVRFLGYLLKPNGAPHDTNVTALLKEIALNHPVESLKAQAMNALANALGSGAIRDEDIPLSIKLEALSRALDAHAPHITETLAQLMDDSLPAERATILARLARTHRGALAALVEARSRSENLQPGEVDALLDAAALDSTSHARALATQLLMEHNSSSTRGRAARYLGSNGGAETLSLLRDALDAETSPRTRLLIEAALDEIERALIAEHTWSSPHHSRQDDA